MSDAGRRPRTPDFDARADTYDVLRPADEAWWRLFDVLVEEGDLRGRKVLDVGCGTGKLLAALAERAHAKAWGVDASKEMLAVARTRLPAAVGLRPGRAEELPFRDGWFDRATMALVVHLVDRPTAFAEARRVCAEGGRLAIATFHPEHFDTYWLNEWFPSIRAIDRARFPAPAELERELLGAGFGHVACTRVSSSLTIDRATAIERVRGRHISTFDLLGEEELTAGTARAVAELPEVVESRLEHVVVVASGAGAMLGKNL
jgi:ubiquinone/menaquinone biosynthesis C-methylase UbiE